MEIRNSKYMIRPRMERDRTFSIRVDKKIQDAYEELSSITGYSRNELINIAMWHLLEDIVFEPDFELSDSRVAEFHRRFQNINLADHQLINPLPGHLEDHEDDHLKSLSKSNPEGQSKDMPAQGIINPLEENPQNVDYPGTKERKK